MKSWPLAVYCVALLAMAGCRTPPVIALLEQENRDLEDRVYELADLVDECRRENQELRKRLGTDDGRQGPIGLGLPLELTEPDSGPRPIETEIPDPRELESLDIEVPSADMSDQPLLERQREGGGARPPDSLPAWPTERTEAPKWNGASDAAAARQGHRVAAQQTAQLVADRTQVAADNTRVATITLDERITGGYNLDGRAGDEGIVVQIEPRDSNGQLVPTAAPVAVVVLDPHLSGEAARVARWDFSAEEVAEPYRKSPHSEGIRLEMVWPGAPPLHDRLHLFVRYVTNDGRKIEADRPIEIDLPVLDVQVPMSAGLSKQLPEASRAASGWQGKPSVVTPLPGSEPLRTAQVPRQPRPPTTPPPESPPPQVSPPTRTRPVWSPDRL
jgi:hypothetical protein